MYSITLLPVCRIPLSGMTVLLSCCINELSCATTCTYSICFLQWNLGPRAQTKPSVKTRKTSHGTHVEQGNQSDEPIKTIQISPLLTPVGEAWLHYFCTSTAIPIIARVKKQDFLVTNSGPDSSGIKNVGSRMTFDSPWYAVLSLDYLFDYR